MSAEWNIVDSRKRRRSERKSGKKKQFIQSLHEVNDSDTESVDLGSIAATISAIHASNEILNNSMNTGGIPNASTTTTTMANNPANSMGTTSMMTTVPSTGQNGINSYPNIPVSNQFSALDPTANNSQPPQHLFGTFSASGTQTSFGQPQPQTFNMSGHNMGHMGTTSTQNGYGQPQSHTFNMSEQNLGRMGTTDSSTALILQEIQSMHAGIVNDLTVQFRTDIQKMCGDISLRFEDRFKLLEGKVGQLQEENEKLRRDLNNVSVTGSLQGDAFEQVVNTSVEQAIASHNIVTKKSFEYNVTIACPGVRYSHDENVIEKAKELIHVGLNLPGVKIVNAMRTPYNHHLNRPGLMKVELESVDVKKTVLSQSGRLRSWHNLGPKVIIRGSQTHEMRTQVGNQITFLRGSGYDSQFTVNKNGVLQARPGSQAALNIQSSGQMPQGNMYSNNNQVYPPPQPPPQRPPPSNGYNNSQGYAPPSQPQRPSLFNGYNNNPVYGPPSQQPPRSNLGYVNNSVYTPNNSNSNPNRPSSYAQAAQASTGIANPLTQFMSGNG